MKINNEKIKYALILFGLTFVLMFFWGYFFMQMDDPTKKYAAALSIFFMFATLGSFLGGVTLMDDYKKSRKEKIKQEEKRERELNRREEQKRKDFYDYMKYKIDVKNVSELSNMYEEISELEQNYKIDSSTMTSIYQYDRINNIEEIVDGYQFEAYIGYLLLDLGFDNIYITPSSGDYGVDVVAENLGLKYVIQTKFYTKPVGNKAIQEVIAGLKYYQAKQAVVVTNNIFTQAAINQATAGGVLLWDKNLLTSMINRR